MRFYKNIYPNVGDTTTVEVLDISDTFATVKLLEYDDLEGMLLLSEVSRQRIRSINKLLRIGRKEVVTVLRVDEEKKFIDLSKKKVTDEEQKIASEKFTKLNKVNKIINRIGNEELIYEELWKSELNSFEIFEKIRLDNNYINNFNFSNEIKNNLLLEINKNFVDEKIKLYSQFEIICPVCGIDAIKDSLKQASEKTKITLISSPLFVIEIDCGGEKEGHEILIKSLEDIKTKILSYESGEFTLKKDITKI